MNATRCLEPLRTGNVTRGGAGDPRQMLLWSFLMKHLYIKKMI